MSRMQLVALYTYETPKMKDYINHTDKYFLRSKLILEKENINPLVRYQVFVRKDIECMQGLDKAVAFIKEHAPEAKIYSLRGDGDYCAACEPIMKIEGRVQDLIDLETVYLGHIAGGLTGNIKMQTVYSNAYAIKRAAKEKFIMYFGARHFKPEDDDAITHYCKEAGFDGCSTDIGAKHWNNEGLGTVPHALVLAVFADMLMKGDGCNPSVRTAELFDKHIEKRYSRIMLIDTFNDEIRDTLDCIEQIKNMGGVRIDTCGENYSQSAMEILKFMPAMNIDDKYVFSPGVCISAVWALRLALLKNGFADKTLTVSSGFNPEKTAAFMEADRVFKAMYNAPLFDMIGTGSIHPGNIMATSDIVAYFDEKEKKWVEHHKVGRGENPSKRLKLV